MEIQSIIKNRRLELGLTMKDVAKALNVSEATISRYESSDIQNMGIDKLEPLAKVLHCSPGYLMGWEQTLTQDNAAFTADLLLDPQLMEHTKKLRDLTPEHKQTVYDTIDFLYEKEK